MILKFLTKADQRLSKGEEIKSHPFFKKIEFDRLRSLPAPYTPEISKTDPTDTSNFDFIPFSSTNSSDAGRLPIEDYVNGDRLDFNGRNLDHAFFEFTFRRFFDGSGHPYPSHGASLALSLPNSSKCQSQEVKESISGSNSRFKAHSPGATVVTIDCSTNATSTSALSATSSSTTTSTGATSSSGVTIACQNGNLVYSDEKSDHHLPSGTGSGKIHSNYNKNDKDDSGNASTSVTATGNSSTSNTGPGGTPVYV